MNGRPNPALRSALAYARRGWPVLPLWWPAGGRCACGAADCDSIGKHPIGHLVPHGLRDASTDPGAVASWWRASPHANVGVRTGAESGLVVLDIDGTTGQESARRLVAGHGRFDAAWARTGSGGWHAYLAHPGVPVPNSTGRIGEGLDVRGDGGYVVAPPSHHASLHPYHWYDPRAERTALDGRELPSAPGWLVELAAAPDPGRSTSRLERMPAPEGAPDGSLWFRRTDGRGPAAGAGRPVSLRPDQRTSYAAAAVERETREVAQTPPGRRNDRLNVAAFRLGQLVGAGLVDEATVTEALVAAALVAGPGERKIRATVRSGLRAGMDRPRQVEVEHGQPASEVGGQEAEPC